jgi:hypothetical protein
MTANLSSDVSRPTLLSRIIKAIVVNPDIGFKFRLYMQFKGLTKLTPNKTK